MKTFETLYYQNVHRHEVSTCCWKNGADRLARCRVGTNLQFIKSVIAASTVKRSTVN